MPSEDHAEAQLDVGSVVFLRGLLDDAQLGELVFETQNSCFHHAIGSQSYFN